MSDDEEEEGPWDESADAEEGDEADAAAWVESIDFKGGLVFANFAVVDFETVAWSERAGCNGSCCASGWGESKMNSEVSPDHSLD